MKPEAEDAKVADLRQKIAVEEKVKEGALHMLRQLTDRNARLVCESNLAESNKRLQYLRTELERALKKRKGSSTQVTTPSSRSSHSHGAAGSDEALAPAEGSPASDIGLSSFTPPGDAHVSVYQGVDAALPPLPAGSAARPATSPLTASVSSGSTGNSRSLGSWLNSLMGRSGPSNVEEGDGAAAAARASFPQLNETDESVNESELTAFDMLKTTTALSSAKVHAKCRAIRSKIDVELRVKTGTQKMYDAVAKLADRRQAQEVSAKLSDATHRVAALQKALQRYEALYVSTDEEEDGAAAADESSAPLSAPATRKYSGKLALRLLGAQGLPNRSSHKSELFWVVRIDGHIKLQTKPSKTLKASDEHEIVVDNGAEAEIAVYERLDAAPSGLGAWMTGKSASSKSLARDGGPAGGAAGGGAADGDTVASLLREDSRILALTWFRLGDLEDALGAKRRRSAGLATAPPAAAPSGTSPVAPQPRSASLPQVPAVETLSLADAAAPPPPPQEAGISCQMDLEPGGVAAVRLNLLQFNLKRRRKSGLARRRPVQKVFPQRGHKFVLTQFYQIVKCATCGEFLMRGLGYQCQACKYACHRACHMRVITKCITEGAAGADDAGSGGANAPLHHKIPHRFEPHTCLAPTWCAHCGFLLPLGKKKATSQCSECKLCAHAECAALVPNFCGLSYELMNHLLAALEQAEAEKKQRMFLKERREAEAEQIRIRLLEEEKRRATAVQAQEQLLLNKGFGGAAEQPATVVEVRTTVADTSASVAVVRGATAHMTLDDFHFLAVLGKGNFGKVMLVEDKATRQLFAIKILKKEFVIENDEVESTKSEKRVFLTATSARHPFLVNLHSCFQTPTRIFFVMEYVSGGDLMWHIQHQQFSERRARFYACEVLLALEYFHRCGIVYRDLKLDNILLTLDGHIKIADYGLCKENMHYGATTSTFCGTPEFMAPEILVEKPYTRAVDWWAFGVLIYEMLLGQSPFKGEDEDEIFEAILHDELLYPVSLNKDAVDLLRRLLCKDPARRLGAGRGDAEEVKAHPYFNGTDWDAMLQLRIPPPFFPQIRGATDISNFDEEFTREKPVLTPLNSVLSAADQDEFRDFSFVSEWALAMRGGAAPAAPVEPAPKPPQRKTKYSAAPSPVLPEASGDASVSPLPAPLTGMPSFGGVIPSGPLPTGQVPTGQVPTGQVPMGQVPMGPVPMGQHPMAQHPMAQHPMAQHPMAQHPMAQNPAGQLPQGQVAMFAPGVLPLLTPEQMAYQAYVAQQQLALGAQVPHGYAPGQGPYLVPMAMMPPPGPVASRPGSAESLQGPAGSRPSSRPASAGAEPPASSRQSNA